MSGSGDPARTLRYNPTIVAALFDFHVLIQRPLQVLATVATIVVGTSLGAFGIVKVLGYPTRTALVVSAALAQIGEFSFLLAGLGVCLGLLPPVAQSLILAGAILSLTLNPFVFRAVEPRVRRAGETRPEDEAVRGV